MPWAIHTTLIISFCTCTHPSPRGRQRAAYLIYRKTDDIVVAAIYRSHQAPPGSLHCVGTGLVEGFALIDVAGSLGL